MLLSPHFDLTCVLCDIHKFPIYAHGGPFGLLLVFLPLSTGPSQPSQGLQALNSHVKPELKCSGPAGCTLAMWNFNANGQISLMIKL